MIRSAQILLMPSHTSQPQRGAGLFLALAAPELEPRNSPSTPSPKIGSVAWQGAEDDADHRKLWLTHSLLLPLETWQASRYSSSAARLHRRPYRDALQTSVSIERQFSPIPLSSPRSLALVLIPRPAARRVSASPLRAPCGFRLSEKLFCEDHRKEKGFLNLPKKRRLTLGAGHLASLRARVSRGQSGQIQTGEMTWNSTKTKSL